MAYSKFMVISGFRLQLLASHDICERRHEEGGGGEDEDGIEHRDLELASCVCLFTRAQAKQKDRGQSDIEMVRSRTLHS